MNVRGFFLIECICYIALFSLIMVFFLRYVVSTTLHIKKITKDVVSLSHAMAAQQLLEHDIWSAPSISTDWKLIADKSLIWKTNEGDRGWLFEKNNLYRIHGAYDDFEHQWTKKIKHVVARAIESVHFTVFYKGFELNKTVSAVQFSIAMQGDTHSIMHTVALQNRYL